MNIEFMDGLLGIINDFAFFAFVTLAIMVFTNARIKGNRKAAVIIPVSVGLLIADYFLYTWLIEATDMETADIVRGAVVVIVCTLLPQIAFETGHKFLNIIKLMCVPFILEAFFSLFYVFKDGHVAPDRKYNALENLFCLVLYLAFGLIMYLLSRYKNFENVRAIITTVPLWFYGIVLLFCYAAYFRANGKQYDYFNNASNVLFILSAAGLLISAGYFVYKIFYLIFQQNRIAKQLDVQQKNYEQMLQSDTQLREFRHDYKNHMLVVTAFLNNGQIDEATKYLETIRETSGIAARKFVTGSFVADAVLNNKNLLCEDLGIILDFGGRIPPGAFNDTDLCTVIANLIDNAIEANKRNNLERYIHVKANIRGRVLTISVTNPTERPIEIKNNKIKTSKSDTLNHGIGLRNVRKTAEKYSGTLLLSCENNVFRADCRMNIPSDIGEYNEV